MCAVASKVAKNNLLPQLNFVGNVGAQGLDDTLPNAYEEWADLNHWSYTLGLQLEVPIGNRAARAIWQRSLLQRQQAIESYRSCARRAAAHPRVSECKQRAGIKD